MIRRLDHVAVLVRDTEAALRHFRDRLGLRVAHVDVVERPPARLTYLDAGNAYVQLVEPLGASPVADALEANGEGIHHICFGTDDPVADAAAFALAGEPVAGSGRSRVSAFVPGAQEHGVRIECTAFELSEDVERTLGWLPGESVTSG